MSDVTNSVIMYRRLLRQAAGLLAPDSGRVALFLVLSFFLAMTDGFSVAMILPIVGLENSSQVVLSIPLVGHLLAPLAALPTRERLILAAAILAVILLTRGALQYGTQILSGLLPLRLQRRLATESYSLLLGARYGFFARTDHGQLIAQIRDFPVMVAGCVRAVIGAVINLMLIGVYLCLMLLISWQLTLGAVAVMGAILLLLKFVNERYLLPAGHALGAVYARINTLLQETVLGMKLIRLQTAEEKMKERFGRVADELYRTNKSMTFVQELQSPLSTTIAGLLVCGLLVGGALFLSTNTSALLGTVAVFIASLYKMLGPAVLLTNSHSVVTMNMAGFEQLERFQRQARAASELSAGKSFHGFTKSIDFEGVAFAYEGSGDAALTEASLRVPKGSIVALVGPSGAGKSTMLGLLSRLYEPTGGRILVDGVDLAEYSLKSWRKKLAVVSQDTVLFNDTVANNLSFGLSDVSRADIEAAAQFAAADEFIQQLPQGYDTPLGDRGARLSGGQQQRLALARAFLVKPEILLLDEATSQLDSFTEHAVQKAVRELRGKTTIVVVAHRLSTVQLADEIIVMNKGSVVERGRHGALIASRGVYWDMLQHQRLDLAAAAPA